MSDLAMQLSVVFLIVIVGAVIFFFTNFFIKLQELESQIRCNKSAAEENYSRHWERIGDLRNRFRALEEHLGIEYVTRSEQCYTKAKGETE